MDFIKCVEEACGKKTQITFEGMQKGDVVLTYGSNEKAKPLLGYEPKVSVTKGVTEFVKWYKGYYEK